MSNWFKVSISFNHIDEKGNEKKTVEQHLFDAISYAEAEERMYKKAEIMIHGEFKLESVTKQKISDVFFFVQGEKWYKCKVSYIDIEDKTGKEKKVTSFMMIEADTVKQAYERMETSLNNMAVPFEITAISESPILEIFPYDAEERIQKLTDGLERKLSEQNTD